MHLFWCFGTNLLRFLMSFAVNFVQWYFWNISLPFEALSTLVASRRVPLAKSVQRCEASCAAPWSWTHKTLIEKIFTSFLQLIERISNLGHTPLAHKKCIISFIMLPIIVSCKQINSCPNVWPLFGSEDILKQAFKALEPQKLSLSYLYKVYFFFPKNLCTEYVFFFLHKTLFWSISTMLVFLSF